jgi:hypothetical protein
MEHPTPKAVAVATRAAVDMPAFFRSAKGHLAAMRAAMWCSDGGALFAEARAARTLAVSVGSRSVAGRACAIEEKAARPLGGGDDRGSRVTDVDALEQQLEAASALWGSCGATV